MKLDFSKLDNLKAPDGHRPPRPIEEQGDIISLKSEAELLEEARLVYKTHQEAIKKSECLQCEILKGVSNNDDFVKLFLKACEVISLITGTKEFYTQIKRDIGARE